MRRRVGGPWVLRVGGKAPPNARWTSHRSIVQALAPHSVHTLTVDRGHEFALGPALQESLGAPIYFRQARRPWQHGSDENTNAPAARRAPPPGPHMDGISPTRIQQVHDQLNQRPRKHLDRKPLRKPTHRTLHSL